MNILSVKYSINRKEEYQLKTIIYEYDGLKSVKKSPAKRNSRKHIKQIFKNYSLLQESSLTYTPAQLEGNDVIFPFIDGESLDYLLFNLIRNNNIDEFLQKIIGFKKMLEKDGLLDYESSDKFTQVFGIIEGLEKKKSLRISNIDLNFDNIILNNNQLVAIDYEWVFDFPIPYEFIFYRALNIFFTKYRMYLEGINLQILYKQVGFYKEDIETYAKMEKSFMNYVGLGIIDSHSNYLKYNDRFILDEQIVNYSKSSKQTEDYLQVFYDTGEGFNEQESEKYLIQKYEEQETIRITIDKQIKALRIDPSNSVGIIDIIEGVLILNEYSSLSIKEQISSIYGMKSISEEGGSVYFSINNDPQIVISFEEYINVDSVYLVFEYSKIQNSKQAIRIVELVEDVMQKELDDHKNIYNQQKASWESLELCLTAQIVEKDIQFQELLVMKENNEEEYNKRIANLEKENQVIFHEKNGMENSLSWKITAPLRKLKKYLNLKGD